MTWEVDTVVVGAGIVGLAVASTLARAGREVTIVEAADGIGQGVSSRSSEVLHAGLYYPPGSIKAADAVRGQGLAYAWLARHGVPHARIGKWVVATTAEEAGALDAILHTARANGATVAPAAPPAGLWATAALDSPNTGIVDSHAWMRSLLADAEAHGATLVTRAAVARGEVRGDGRVALRIGDTTVVAARLVNAAGLGAVALARAIDGLRGPWPTLRYAKGRYLRLRGPSPAPRLVYPVPVSGGLGVHLTLDLAGQARFGPDVAWVPAPDYAVEPEVVPAFEASIRRWWPGLPDGALTPDYAGVRPKLVGPGEPAADFVVRGPEAHGGPGQVHLLGIESPGLTACLALAERVRNALA